MKKKLISLLLALIWPVFSLAEMAEDTSGQLTVGTPTALTGSFFSTLFDGTTSDQDVQDLLHTYSLVCWDPDGARFRFDRSVVEDAVIMDDAEGNRNYLLVLYDDLFYSDGTRITAKDYAFSLLFSMDPILSEIGGRPRDCSWLKGSEDYESGKPVSGLRILSEQMLEITVKAEALPYFYELSRLTVKPYPINVIAPGTDVADAGEGAYLTKALSADMLKVTLLDGKTGYISHPSVVSGPYQLVSFDGVTAEFEVNLSYKGDEKGETPAIEKLIYTQADSKTMIDDLRGGKYGLLNKVTEAEAIKAGMSLVLDNLGNFSLDNYARDGQTLIWFCEDSEKAQELAVRKAIALCLDRKGFTREYAENFGMVTDGLYGVGTWMYLLTEGTLHYTPDGQMKETGVGSEEEIEVVTEETAEEEVTFSLEGMTLYDVDLEAAAEALNKAGWNKNVSGRSFQTGVDNVRYRKEGGGLTPLTLTMAVPDSDKAVEAIRKYFVPNLDQVGFDVKLERLGMKELTAAYMAGTGYDMIYAGDNFSVIFNVYFVQPTMDPETVTGAAAAEDSLTMSRKELYEMALDMVHTENSDIIGFEQKWIRLQERLSETLTIIPVYSNVYFDFFERQLHDYDISRASSWGEAIVPAYLSELEEITQEEETTVRQRIGMYEQ